ncbi:hypothetical protein BH23PLA1_BH23PLA1_01600 [soil metagenome]
MTTGPIRYSESSDRRESPGPDRPSPDRAPSAFDDRIESTSTGAELSLVLDEALRIVTCNNAFAHWIGWPDTERLQGVPLAETLDPFSRSKLSKLPGRLLAGRPLNMELNHLNSRGHPLLTRYHLFPPGTLGKFQRHIVALGSDRQADMGLLEELIDLKRGREAQLARVQELAWQLEQQNDDLRAISHMIHHDVSNGLNAISLTCALLERQTLSDPEAVRRGSAEVRRLCQHVAGILKGFISLADLARKPTRPECVDLDRETRSILEIVAANRPQTRHRADIRLDTPHVWAQPEHIRQILENLLTNAFKYRDPDKPELQIHFSSRPHGPRVRLEVADNGLGIPEDRQATIFDLFTRAHDGEGRGVGLAIVKRLVEVNGGAVTLRSCPGQGATFLIDLPAEPT